MKTEPTSFYSDHLRLSAAFFLPDDDDGAPTKPLVIPNSGFTGLMNIHPARFARSLTAAGHRCFAFDYRGFAESEGDVGRVLLEEQVRDIMHAVAFASKDPRVDSNRIILLGWGMAGGLILDAARELPGIIGLIAANGFYNGLRVQKAHRSEHALNDFLNEVAEERARRATTGETTMVDPFHIYPLDPASREYVENTLRTFEHYADERYSMEMADSLIRWNPEMYACSMNIPLLIAHGDGNKLHPVSEAESLYDIYAGPKELFWIEGAGHTEFMHDDDPRYQSLASKVVQFVNQLVE